MLEVCPVRVLDDNYAWILGPPRGSLAVVVDPGQAAPVAAALARRSQRLAAILLTHHHSDHVGGVLELVADTAAPVYGPRRDAIPTVDHPVGDGDRIEIPEAELALERAGAARLAAPARGRPQAHRSPPPGTLDATLAPRRGPGRLVIC